jgi:hypothetical protein
MMSALGASALALCVSACKVDSRPLLARGEPPAYAAVQPAAYPYADDLGLPYAQPAPVRPVQDPYDGYALAERAYAYDRAAYRAPPDYGFHYGEIDPWAWQLADNSLMFAEPYGEDYRFYYYEPGATYPYFVRDPYYGYGYGENGALMAVFDAAGALLPDGQLSQLAAVAGRYLARGSDLRNVYYDAPRYTVADRLWVERAPAIYAEQEPWIRAAETYPVWREYRVSTGERFLSAFEPERARRERVAARYEDRIDWDEAKAERKAWREQAKAEHKFIREQAKEERKFVREASKEDRKFVREHAKATRKLEREQARNAFAAAQPAAARVEERRGREARNEAAPPQALREDPGGKDKGGKDRGGKAKDGWKDGGKGKPDHAAHGHGGGDHGKGKAEGKGKGRD